MRERCEREVVELHRFFQDWFNGSISKNEQSIKRLTDVLNDKFILIPPNGVVIPKVELLARIESAHGSTASGKHRNQIWVENFEVRYQDHYILLATYTEWQELEGELNGRISTVLFSLKPGTPNGVEWLHVHETKVPVGN